MGLYNMVLGVHPLAGVLLGVLDLEPKAVPRLRDASLHEDSIRILTRTGGGNRAEYQSEIDTLRKHPLYIRDEDDAYDSTYALFYFRWPEDCKDELNDLLGAIKTHRPELLLSLGERWETALKNIMQGDGAADGADGEADGREDGDEQH